MSECAPSGLPIPGPQHAWLMSNVGEWHADCTFFLGPEQPPMKSTATDSVVAHGPFFVLGRFAGEMFGAPMVGLATLGFDPLQDRFVSTWIDSFSPHLYHFTGQLDASGKRLEMRARAPMPGAGTLTDWRSTEEHRDDGTRVFEMYLTVPGGPEMKISTHVYRRR